MKILILGYGKMGKTIDYLAMNGDHESISVDNIQERTDLVEENFDVAIEFSQPDAAVENIKFCLDHGIPVVSGTTGWLDRLSELEEYCKSKNGTFFYTSNFSIGVNLFFKLNEWMAKLMNRYQGYDVIIDEIHHAQKLDSPSGTAITIADHIVEHMDIKKGWEENAMDSEMINITSMREGSVAGTHIVRYESELDVIELKHKAYTRESFARGALMVAEWAKDKKGVLTMNDFMNS